jgi:hypothetical protein
MPTEEQVNKAFELISKLAINYEYFFSKLNDPNWIRPLRERGLFNDPPPAVRNENGFVIGAAKWPQSEFLKRVASKAPEEVLQIALEIKTDNYFIISDLTEAANTMSGDYAEKWADKLCHEIIDDKFSLGLIGEKAGDLISHLSKQGKFKIALNLTRKLLAVLPDPENITKLFPKVETKRKLSPILESRIRMEQYEYEEILKKNIPDLAKGVPFETIELLNDLLEKAIIYSLPGGEKEKPHDFSYISRPAIEDHEQNRGYGIEDLLIPAIRDIAENLCNSDPEAIVKVIQKIELHGWYIFIRIGMYLLWVIKDPPFQMIENRLVNKEMFNSLELNHEYYNLIKKYFGQLSPEGQKRVLSWIEEAEEEKGVLKETKELTKEQRESRIEWWQYEKLISIQEYLTGKWANRFLKLKNELGEPTIPPGFHGWISGGWAGPVSPMNPEDLARMNINEQIEYLKNWTPTGNWEAPTPDGLGTAFSSLVAERPEKYTDEIGRFLDNNLDPTYIRHTISGFFKAIEKGNPISYGKVFKLCKWVVDHPRDIPDRKIPKGLREDFEIDVGWSKTRHEIARLIEEVFKKKAKVPYTHREVIWNIIEPLSNDPEPDLEYESKYDGESLNPLTLSWNTIRGKALHGVMDYSMWVFNQIKKEREGIEGSPPCFKDMPEVQKVLDKHLDLQGCLFAKNLTDRAVYGQWLPQLIHVDPDWVKSNLFKIFPKEYELRPLREAAWNTYLSYSALHTQVYDVIKDVYFSEINEIKVGKEENKTRKTPKNKLTEHVIMLYVWDRISLEENDLISLFYKVAPPELSAYSIEFIGRSINRERSLNSEIINKFKGLWEWRIDKLGGIQNLNDKEMAAFGWWFASGTCGDDWAFPYLETTLQRTTLKESKMDVFEYMSRVFMEFPDQSLRCLNLFIDKNDDRWFFLQRKGEGVWRILEQGLAHVNPQIREKAEDLVHLLGSKGYLEYRELLKREQ